MLTERILCLCLKFDGILKFVKIREFSGIFKIHKIRKLNLCSRRPPLAGLGRSAASANISFLCVCVLKVKRTARALNIKLGEHI